MVKCIRCGAEIPDDAEFCPKCHSLAAWSQADPKDVLKASVSSHKYQNVNSEVAKPERNWLKLFWLIGVIIIILTIGYYFLDKYVIKAEPEAPTALETKAIHLVQNSHLLESKRTTGKVLADWSETGKGITRVIGWKAQAVGKSEVYFVTYNYDDDQYDFNGTKYFFFEANTKTGKVLKANETLTAKYKKLGFIE